MPTKKTPSTKKTPATKVAKTTKGDIKTLRGELFSLKMKHALRELKEVHKLRQARRAVARHLTTLHKSI